MKIVVCSLLAKGYMLTEMPFRREDNWIRLDQPTSWFSWGATPFKAYLVSGNCQGWQSFPTILKIQLFHWGTEQNAFVTNQSITECIPMIPPHICVTKAHFEYRILKFKKPLSICIFALLQPTDQTWVGCGIISALTQEHHWVHTYNPFLYLWWCDKSSFCILSTEIQKTPFYLHFCPAIAHRSDLSRVRYNIYINRWASLSAYQWLLLVFTTVW